MACLRVRMGGLSATRAALRVDVGKRKVTVRQIPIPTSTASVHLLNQALLCSYGAMKHTPLAGSV